MRSDCFLLFEAILNIRGGLFADWPVPCSLSAVSMAFTKLSSNFSLVHKTTQVDELKTFPITRL